MGVINGSDSEKVLSSFNGVTPRNKNKMKLIVNVLLLFIAVFVYEDGVSFMASTGLTATRGERVLMLPGAAAMEFPKLTSENWEEELKNRLDFWRKKAQEKKEELKKKIKERREESMKQRQERREKMKERREENKEKRKERREEFFKKIKGLKNKDRREERKKMRKGRREEFLKKRQERREKMKEKREENKEKRMERRKELLGLRKEKIEAIKKRWAELIEELKNIGVTKEDLKSFLKKNFPKAFIQLLNKFFKGGY